MDAHTETPPPLSIIRTAAARLAAPLVKHELHVKVDEFGVVEIRNPLDSRMKQALVLAEHDGGLWWHWCWTDAGSNVPPELEPMCPADDVDEAARRIANVLSVRV